MTKAEFLYSKGDAIPAEVFEVLPEDFGRAFVAEPDFVGLGPGLPKLKAALSELFAPPMLRIRWVRPGIAVQHMQFSSESSTVFGEIRSRDTQELSSPEKKYGALPAPFMSYYQWLDGIQLTSPDAMPSMGWYDLPCAYPARGELRDYAKSLAINAASVNGIYRRFDSKSLQAWIRCKTGDVFFADEYNQRGQLFHLKFEQPDVISEVQGDDFLDTYAAFVLRSNGAAEFNFSQWLRSL